MEYKQSEKQAVLDAIKNCSSSLSFDNLKAITGLGLMELSTLIGLLVKENRILVRFNHAKDKSYLYKSSGEALYDRFKDLLFLYRGKERKVAFYASELCISPKYLTAVVKECSVVKLQQNGLMKRLSGKSSTCFVILSLLLRKLSMS